MRGDASAYEALGLKPGAGPAEIDQAYRTLIKRYHPDRAGGDAARAAEINHAYFRLRKSVEQEPEAPRPASVAEALYARRAAQPKRRRSRKKVRIWPAVLLVAAILGYLKREQLRIIAEDGMAELQRRIEPPINEGSQAGDRTAHAQSIEEPVDPAVIRSAVKRAAAMHDAGDEDAMTEESRACHRRLHAQPSIKKLDRCAAFDDAVLELQRRDPLRDEGPFGATAITARQINAGTLLSDDYLAIEARLDRVRGRVQLLLAPPEPPPPAPVPVNSALP